MNYFNAGIIQKSFKEIEILKNFHLKSSNNCPHSKFALFDWLSSASVAPTLKCWSELEYVSETKDSVNRRYCMTFYTIAGNNIWFLLLKTERISSSLQYCMCVLSSEPYVLCVSSRRRTVHRKEIFLKKENRQGKSTRKKDGKIIEDCISVPNLCEQWTCGI